MRYMIIFLLILINFYETCSKSNHFIVQTILAIFNVKNDVELGILIGKLLWFLVNTSEKSIGVYYKILWGSFISVSSWMAY